MSMFLLLSLSRPVYEVMTATELIFSSCALNFCPKLPAAVNCGFGFFELGAGFSTANLLIDLMPSTLAIGIKLPRHSTGSKGP